MSKQAAASVAMSYSSNMGNYTVAREVKRNEERKPEFRSQIEGEKVS